MKTSLSRRALFRLAGIGTLGAGAGARRTPRGKARGAPWPRDGRRRAGVDGILRSRRFPALLEFLPPAGARALALLPGGDAAGWVAAARIRDLRRRPRDRDRA